MYGIIDRIAIIMFKKAQHIEKDDLKMLAAYQAYAEIPSSCVVGLGSGTTVRFFIEALGKLTDIGTGQTWDGKKNRRRR